MQKKKLTLILGKNERIVDAFIEKISEESE